MATTYVTRTIGSGSAGRTFTISFWLKIASITANHTIVGLSSDNNSTKYVEIALKSNHKLDIQFRNGTSGDNGTYLRRRTNRLFRDTNAWYHIVLRVDSTQASASDRVRIYVNGVQETSIDVDSTPDMPQNYVTDFNNNGSIFRIGRGAGSSSYYLDGLLSHFHFADGQSYAPTVFGSTDSTTGEWKINASPTFTPGTEGFTILKNGNTITDQSANSNDFSLGGGTLSNYVDNPSHVFNTMDSKNKSSVVDVRRCGNTTVGTSNSSTGTARSNWNIPATGKWYFEYKMIPDNQGNTYPNSGIKYNAAKYYNPDHSNSDADIFVYGTYGSVLLYVRNGTNITAGAPASSGDIFGFAIDQDNGAIYVHENGTYMSQGGNVGVPTSGSSKTGAVFTYTAGTYPDMCLVGKEFGNSETQWNFGNGIFFTTPVSSAGTNASNIGIFEYDVPAGYTALSTKGLNN